MRAVPLVEAGPEHGSKDVARARRHLADELGVRAAPRRDRPRLDDRAVAQDEARDVDRVRERVLAEQRR